jgi:hypothetical protein
MGRLFHLQQTYLQSIESTKDYPKKEFVLLNYGSKDDLDDWILSNFSKFDCEFKYYKTSIPNFWCAAHAKNICYKQATGDILVNLDCDNILVSSYCNYLNNLFIENKNIIVASDSADPDGNHGCCGMISSRKENFYSVNGYDEDFTEGWGVDDTNYQFRCRMKNNLKLVIQDKKYNHCVPHSCEVRTQNCKNKDLHETKKNSENKLLEIYKTKKYVANLEKSWGYSEDLVRII